MAPLVLYCNCGYYDLVPDKTRAAIFSAPVESGCEFEAVQDLCELAAGRDPRLKHWAQREDLTIIACFARSIKWLFHAAGAPLDFNKVRVLNARGQSPEKIISALGLDKKSPTARRDVELSQKGDWAAWFPVIDYDRCKDCKQCLNFCLFGVYELSPEGKVIVTNPANCKTNCPACARACPEAAVIFPKYAHSPLNGDKVPGDIKTQAGLSKFADADILEKIRQRSKVRKRFATDAPDKGRIIRELQKKLDIPDEVLASLSPGEMTRLKQKSTGIAADIEPGASL